MKTKLFSSVKKFSLSAITLILIMEGAGRNICAQDALSSQQLKLPDMPLHDPFILPYEPTKTY